MYNELGLAPVKQTTGKAVYRIADIFTKAAFQFERALNQWEQLKKRPALDPHAKAGSPLNTLHLKAALVTESNQLRESGVHEITINSDETLLAALTKQNKGITGMLWGTARDESNIMKRDNERDIQEACAAIRFHQPLPAARITQP